jgi:hypothetical protein
MEIHVQMIKNVELTRQGTPSRHDTATGRIFRTEVQRIVYTVPILPKDTLQDFQNYMTVLITTGSHNGTHVLNRRVTSETLQMAVAELQDCRTSIQHYRPSQFQLVRITVPMY